MKKTLIAVLSAVTLFAPMQIAKAADERVVAIIDSAIDSSSIPSITYEACFTQNSSCPNGQKFMEGKGSANSFGRDGALKPLVGPIWIKSTNFSHPIYHGLKMVTASTKTNSNIKIVFIRIADVTSIGNSLNAGQSFSQAMDWVSKNASKYSIDAVSVSQSRVNWTTCPTDLVVSNAIKSLQTQNIPTFIATGNDKLKDKVGFPACVDGAIGVGAMTFDGSMLQAVTNSGPGLDVVAVGDIKKALNNTYDITGTSVATAVAATKYVGQTSLFDQFVSGITRFLTYPFIR
jgi:hypothetical protein